MSDIDDSGWEVPDHRIEILSPKRHRHALVIPVINEGERIRGQLRAIAAAGPPVDVVIADGGSTDSSLKGGILAETGVRTLLTKTGPGRLGAQLRMAYAWCLKDGYDGVVTIDGNGKDGVEAIGDMVKLLEDGFDYIQGSRYRPGGAAVNTPLERTLANRAIHAPLLSIAARRRFTDTTNGFRAYSARYLLDHRVKPFRDVFGDYALLFYLTARASRIGMRTAEVPVRRAYPDSGKTPTKIAGLPGKLAMLRELSDVVRGRYAPD